MTSVATPPRSEDTRPGRPLVSDPAVPGAALITDEARLRRRLAAVGERLRSVDYLRHKSGTSLVAGLWLTSGPAFAYAVAETARDKLDKTIQRAPAGSVLLTDPELGLLVGRPAADRDLPALAHLDEALAIDHVTGADLAEVRTRSALAYKPQRRWVGRLDLADGSRLVARAYRPADLPATELAWRVAGSLDGWVPVPTVRGIDRARGLVLTDWMPGTPLDRWLTDGGTDREVLRRVGAGLARLHAAARRPVHPSADSSAEAELVGPLDAVTDQLATVLPELAARGRELLDHLRATAPRPGEAHPVHGDFSADQVIVDPAGRIAVTDWDRAGWADPAVDLGSLRAAGLDPMAYAEVLAGYTTVRPQPAGVDWHLARARLLRLVEPLRRARPDWRQQISTRLGELEALLDAAGSKEQDR